MTRRLLATSHDHGMSLQPDAMMAAAVALVCVCIPVCAEAQEAEPYTPPRTHFGDPSFEGVWASEFLTTIERPDNFKDLVLGPEQTRELIAELTKPSLVRDPNFENFHKNALAVVYGQTRSSLVIEPTDGRLPFSKLGLEMLDKRAAKIRLPDDNPEDRRLADRCLTGLGQAPLRPTAIFAPNLIVQTKDAVVIWSEDVDGPRIVHLNSAPPPAVMRSYEGWSAGRWEGDTLVIETTHVRADDPYRFQTGKRPILVSAESKIIERLTRLSESELLLQFTVEDAGLYVRPWLAEFVLSRDERPVLEFGCHEFNYSLANILRGAAFEEQEKAGKVTPPASTGK